jgi:hypothetical protein
MKKPLLTSPKGEGQRPATLKNKINEKERIK